MTVILDYGMGNLRSVERAVRHLGHACEIQTNLARAEKLILPGVGAFAAAMEHLRALAPEILSFARNGFPLLGVCLGQQLLFDRSEELGGADGLGLLPGDVVYLRRDRGVKVPHIGWNSLEPTVPDGLMTGIAPGEQVYFDHSLIARCRESTDVAATSEHGIEFAAAVRRGNIWGTQFHPEKSGEVGLRILRNFLEC